MPHNEFRELASSMVQAFAEDPGRRWKIWLMDEAKNEAEAIYLATKRFWKILKQIPWFNPCYLTRL